MDFISNDITYDVNFHEKELGYCKITGCKAVEKDKEAYLDHVEKCLFEQKLENWVPFWSLLKMNLIHDQEVSLVKFEIRCNTLRLEEGQGNISYTNDQQ
jgi:hypothetical protein